MKNIFDVNGWVDTPEKRMRLVRISYLIALGMTILGFVLILMSFFSPGFLL
jgi:hypothetical protein